jgi:hypothetical protein
MAMNAPFMVTAGLTAAIVISSLSLHKFGDPLDYIAGQFWARWSLWMIHHARKVGMYRTMVQLHEK